MILGVIMIIIISVLVIFDFMRLKVVYSINFRCVGYILAVGVVGGILARSALFGARRSARSWDNSENPNFRRELMKLCSGNPAESVARDMALAIFWRSAARADYFHFGKLRYTTIKQKQGGRMKESEFVNKLDKMNFVYQARIDKLQTQINELIRKVDELQAQSPRRLSVQTPPEAEEAEWHK